MESFDAPHEAIEPSSETPQAVGVHYLNTLTRPGDSYSFKTAKQILALPTAALWDAAVDGIKLAVALKPQCVISIHAPASFREIA